MSLRTLLLFFFFNDTATTEIYTLSLHDALPISTRGAALPPPPPARKETGRRRSGNGIRMEDCKLRRSEEHTSELRHGYISYAVFCLKKKKIENNAHTIQKQKISVQCDVTEQTHD